MIGWKAQALAAAFVISLGVGAAEPAVQNAPVAKTAAAAPVPSRIFVQIQRYNMEKNGEANSPISNVRLEVSFANGTRVPLPEGGQWWPIGNGQVQEINRTFEVPWAMTDRDAFKFTVQMYRKGSDFLPCKFDVNEVSQFNRSYVCRTDAAWQVTQGVAEDQISREGIQIRVFTDRNSTKAEVPNDAIAIR